MTWFVKMLWRLLKPRLLNVSLTVLREIFEYLRMLIEEQIRQMEKLKSDG